LTTEYLFNLSLTNYNKIDIISIGIQLNSEFFKHKDNFMSMKRITLASILLLLVFGTLFFSCSNSKKQENKETADNSSLGSSNAVGGTTETSDSGSLGSSNVVGVSTETSGYWPSDEQWKSVGLPGLKQPAGTKGEPPEFYGVYGFRFLSTYLRNSNASHFDDLRQQMENILGKAPTIRDEDDNHRHVYFSGAYRIDDQLIDIYMSYDEDIIFIYCDYAEK